MTMTFDTDFAATDDAPLFNPLQVVAMDGLITVGLIAALKTGGMGWGLSLLTGWVGGALLTTGLMFGAAYICLRPTVTRNKQSDGTEWKEYSPLVPDELTETMQVWDADLALEREHWARIAESRKVVRKSRRSSTKMVMKMWNDDLQNERNSSIVMPRRAVRVDRRQVSLEMPDGSERRQRGAN